MSEPSDKLSPFWLWGPLEVDTSHLTEKQIADLEECGLLMRVNDDEAEDIIEV